MSTSLQTIIDAAWETRDAIGTDTAGEVREAVDEALRLLDSGKARVATRQSVGQCHSELATCACSIFT